MKRFLICLSSFLILFGTSMAFAGVYSEDFQDGDLDSLWYRVGDYEIITESNGNKYLHMFNASAPEPNDIPCTEVNLGTDDPIYHVEVDLLVPEERYQIVGIEHQWSICEDVENQNCNGLQVTLFHNAGIFQVGLGSFSTTSGGTDLGQVNFPPVNFGEWYHLSITLHSDHITIGIKGNGTNIEEDLFQDIYYKPQSGSYLSFYNHAGVRGCAYSADDPNFVDVDYSIDNLKVLTSTGATINDILTFFDDSVAEGTIKGVGNNPWLAKLRLYLMKEMLIIAKELIERDNIDWACFTLKRANLRCDGATPPPDFVEGSLVSELNDMIMELIAGLGCE